MQDLENIRDAWISTAEGLPPMAFGTFVYNYQTQEGPAERTFYEFCQRVERAGHGSRYLGYPPELRLRAIGGLEDIRRRPHGHACFAGSDRLMSALETKGESIWRKLTKVGEAKIEMLVRNPAGASRYPFKRILTEQEQQLVLAYAPERPSCKR